MNMLRNTFYLGLILVAGIAACTGNKKTEADHEGKVVVTKEQRFDYMTWKIKTANGTWHYEIEHVETGDLSTGFNSAIDRDGNDWIANNCVGMREWRGWPNFGSDGFGHPCRGGEGQSRWLDKDGNPLEFTGQLTGDHLILESWNDNFRLWYHFFPGHAAIEVLEANDLYSFLWEGPPAGEMKVEQQYYVLEDGIKRNIKFNTGLGYIEPEFGRNFPSPFFYFIDEYADQLVYIGVKGQSEGGDEGWCQPGNMVIFSYGRENDERALYGTDAVSVFGFLDKDMGHDNIRTFINNRLDNPFQR
jgi:hypothetical protein